VQEAFLDALCIGRQRPVENWGALLRYLASCRALDLLRKRRPAAALAADPPAPPSARPDMVVVAAEQAVMLRQALTRLPNRQAEVFALRYFSELSNQEIARTLNITVGAVAIALHKARTRLHELLEPDEDNR
jgi:RNA polymerase sigma factor (sigma-70 family)